MNAFISYGGNGSGIISLEQRSTFTSLFHCYQHRRLCVNHGEYGRVVGSTTKMRNMLWMMTQEVGEKADVTTTATSASSSTTVTTPSSMGVVEGNKEFGDVSDENHLESSNIVDTVDKDGVEEEEAEENVSDENPIMTFTKDHDVKKKIIEKYISEDGDAIEEKIIDKDLIEDENEDEDEDEGIDDIIPPVLEPPRAYRAKQHRIELREKYRLNEKDVGSPEFQIASLTSRIQFLTEHLKQHPKDFSSARGVIRMVNRRRKLLKYLKGKKDGRFEAIVGGLGIRINRQMKGLQ